MSEQEQATAGFSDDALLPVRKRPRPGERRLQILQTLASMLEQPGAERVTTASLAGKIGVSEAALYRHFASKAQMFEGLIDFVDESVIGLIRQVIDRAPSGSAQAGRIVAWLVLPLIAGMTYEVVIRHLWQPTQWAYDTSYMIYGAMFMLGAA